MTDPGRAAAERHIEGLPEPRRSQMRHLHDTILEAVPPIDVRMWDYGGGSMIGYGTYPYSTSKGPAGDWFALGLANRKSYISLYSMGMRDGGYLVEAVSDRFPGTSCGKSCLNIKKPELVDDAAVRDLAVETWAQFEGRAGGG